MHLVRDVIGSLFVDELDLVSLYFRNHPRALTNVGRSQSRTCVPVSATVSPSYKHSMYGMDVALFHQNGRLPLIMLKV